MLHHRDLRGLAVGNISEPISSITRVGSLCPTAFEALSYIPVTPLQATCNGRVLSILEKGWSFNFLFFRNSAPFVGELNSLGREDRKWFSCYMQEYVITDSYASQLMSTV